MFVLHKIVEGVTTFQGFETLSEMYAELRANNGLSDCDFFEFMSMGAFERENKYIDWFRGDVPTGDALAARKAEGVAKFAK